MRRADKLDTALGNGSRRLCLKFSSDLVDDDHFGVVVFHRLDHDFMLQRWLGDLHPPRATNRRVRHVAIAADFVARIDNHDTLGFRQYTRRLTQHRRFTNAGCAENQDALPSFDDVAQDVYCSVDSPPDAAGEAHNLAATVADSRDAVQCSFKASAVIGVEYADFRDHML